MAWDEVTRLACQNAFRADHKPVEWFDVATCHTATSMALTSATQNVPGVADDVPGLLLKLARPDGGEPDRVFITPAVAYALGLRLLEAVQLHGWYAVTTIRRKPDGSLAALGEPL